MTEIFVVMEMVDLGGHPVVAFTDEVKAQEHVDGLNQYARDNKLKTLMRDCSYTTEQANAWVSSYWPYDLYETTLEF